MLCLCLERAGYQVRVAPCGRVALEQYNEDPADVVIADLLMPRMTGLELIAEVRRKFPDSKFVAISASKKMLAEARQAGASATLHKPFAPSKLLEILEQVLGGED